MPVHAHSHGGTFMAEQFAQCLEAPLLALPAVYSHPHARRNHSLICHIPKYPVQYSNNLVDCWRRQFAPALPVPWRDRNLRNAASFHHPPPFRISVIVCAPQQSLYTLCTSATSSRPTLLYQANAAHNPLLLLQCLLCFVSCTYFTTNIAIVVIAIC